MSIYICIIRDNSISMSIYTSSINIFNGSIISICNSISTSNSIGIDITINNINILT